MVILAEKKAKSEIDLRKLISKMGLKASEFAEMCGISKQSLAQFMRPGKSLTTNTIYRIANALDIDPRDMFFPVDDETDGETTNNDLSNEAGELIEETKMAGQPQTDNIQSNAAPVIQVQPAFCPHCGKQVRVGVVLLPEE